MSICGHPSCGLDKGMCLGHTCGRCGKSKSDTNWHSWLDAAQPMCCDCWKEEERIGVMRLCTMLVVPDDVQRAQRCTKRATHDVQQVEPTKFATLRVPTVVAPFCEAHAQSVAAELTEHEQRAAREPWPIRPDVRREA